MAVAGLKYITEDEYLALEEKAETKHEYYNGQIYAMAGAAPEHVLIAANVIRNAGNVIVDGPCRVYTSDLRIRVESTGLNTYPDVTIVCGEPRRTDQRPPGVTNPTVLVEVLSDSTAAYDRGEKWRHYQTIPSLTDYLLVWQDRPCVEHYARQTPDSWTYHLVEGLDAAVALRGIPAPLALAEIYRGIELAATEPLRKPAPDVEDGP